MKDRIKKLAVALMTIGMVIGFGAGTAFAGGPHGKHHKKRAMLEKLEKMDEQERLEFLEDKLDRRVAKMSKHLELTEAQEVKVRQIFADAQTRLLDVWERGKDADDKTAVRAEAREVFKEAKQDVAEILTDEQKAKIKERKKKWRHHKRGKRGERGEPGERGERGERGSF